MHSYRSVFLLCKGKDVVGNDISVGKNDHGHIVSFDRLQKFLEREIAARTGLIWEQDISRLKSERKTMEKFLEFVDGKYGGFDGYFRHIGLSDQEINKIGKTMTGRK